MEVHGMIAQAGVEYTPVGGTPCAIGKAFRVRPRLSIDCKYFTKCGTITPDIQFRNDKDSVVGSRAGWVNDECSLQLAFDAEWTFAMGRSSTIESAPISVRDIFVLRAE